MNQQRFPHSTLVIGEATAAPRRGGRWAGVAVMAVLSVGALSACGSSDSESSDSVSSEDAFCDAGDSLRSNIEGIADIDILSGGVDAVTDQLAAIESDVERLRESGSDTATDEISALNAAIDDLEAGLDDLGDDLSIDGVETVASSIGNIVTAAGDVYERLDSACS